MKKNVLGGIFIAALAIGFTGCANTTPNTKTTKLSNNNYQHISISDGPVLAYAYMKNGTDFIKLSTSFWTNKEDIELIKITPSGFYPMYNTSKKVRCDYGGIFSSYDEDFCNSAYVSRKKIYSVARETLKTIGTLGAGTLWEGVKAEGYFDHKKFQEILSSSTLLEEAQKIQLLNKMKNEYQNKLTTLGINKEKEINKIYESYFDKYKANMKNIIVAEKVNDESGLFNGHSYNSKYLIGTNEPEKKQFNYQRTIEIDKIKFNGNKIDMNQYSKLEESIQNQYQDFVKDIEDKYVVDVKNYKEYLTQNFKDYKILVEEYQTYRINDYITYNIIVKAPKSIQYKEGQKLNIEIKCIVKSLNFSHAIPKRITLSNKHSTLNLKSDHKDKNIVAIVSNNTTNFLKINSLTSYYKNDVYTISNVNQELSPESVSIENNSKHSLLSDQMIISSNFNEITKDKAIKTKIKYGYAVKYNLSDITTQKTLYNNKEYSLYDILQDFLHNN